MKKFLNKFLIIYLIAAVSIISIVAGFSLSFYFKSKETLNQSVEKRLTVVLNNAKNIVSAAKHKALREAYVLNGQGVNPQQGIAEPDYIEMRGKLIQLVGSSGVEFIYTINKNEAGGYYFVLDTEEDEQDPTFIGYQYDDLEADKAAVFDRAYDNPTKYYVFELQDASGSHITICQVLLNGTEKETILCVDINDGFMRAHRDAFVLSIVLLEVTLTVAFGLIGFFFGRLLKKNKEMHDKIEALAYYDSLTKLPNRESLMTTLANMEASKVNFALLFIDLDNFKKVNDNEGHLAGDVLLRQIAEFLKSFAENKNPMFKPCGETNEFIARLGGDEFVMICQVGSSGEALSFTNEIFDLFKIMMNNDPVMTRHAVSLSIGIACYPGDADNISMLLKHADMAMYAAKKSGKFKACVYEQGMVDEKKQ